MDDKDESIWNIFYFCNCFINNDFNLLLTKGKYEQNINFINN